MKQSVARRLTQAAKMPNKPAPPSTSLAISSQPHTAECGAAQTLPAHQSHARFRWTEHLTQLRFLVAVAVFFGLALPSLILAKREGITVKQDNLVRLEADLERLSTVSAEGLRDSLWQVSPELGQTVAQVIFQDSRLRLLRVRDLRSEKPFIEYTRPIEKDEAVIVHKQDMIYLDTRIGSVELVMSTASAIHEAQAASFRIYMRALIGLMSSLILIFLVMHWQLVRPIEYLKRMSGKLADKKLDEPICLARRDELGELACSLESTRIALAQSFGELEEKKQELQGYADELELRVEERTRELAATVQTLQQAQNELIESDRLASLGRMVAGIAHELNTPLGSSLTAISTLSDRHRSFLKALEDGALRRSQLDTFIETLTEGLGIMQRNMIRAAEMVDKFRQVAVDQTSEQRRSFQLKAFIEEIQLTLSPRFKHEPVALYTEDGEDLVLDCYPGPLGQVISNLELNTLLHAFEGREQGKVWLKTEALPDARLRISIKDDGIGMSRAIQEHIFEPFFTTRLGRGGSGLGLSIVYNIVTGILGGRITVNSAPGEGSEFVIEIPLVAPEQNRANTLDFG